MTEFIQSEVQIEVVSETLEQKFAANVAITGVAPSLAGSSFTTWYDSADGIMRYKQADDVTKDEADLGGLFSLSHDQPGILEQVLMDLGASVAYTVSVVTTAGTWQVAAGTGQYVVLLPRIILNPGEDIKITAATPGAGKKAWIRVYLRSDQARH